MAQNVGYRPMHTLDITNRNESRTLALQTSGDYYDEDGNKL